MNVQTPLRIFYCYAREDKAFRNALDRHLSGLKRQKHLTWSDQEIAAGEEWKSATDTQLQNAHIVLCLVSPDFLASDYCYEHEMRQALERHKERTARVIPILVRPTYWKNTPLSELQMLPSDALAVTLWSDRDAAWVDVVKGIVPIIQEILFSLKTKEEWLEEGKILTERKRIEEALQVYEQAIQLDPTNSSAFGYKSAVFYRLKRYQEALKAAEQAIELEPTNSAGFRRKGAALNALKDYQKALDMLERAIELDPTNSDAFGHKSAAFYGLRHYQEALEAAEHAIELDPTNSGAFGNKSAALNGLKRYQEALKAAEHAIELDPTYSFALKQKSYALNNLKG